MPRSRRSRRASEPTDSIIYDTGALVSAERRSRTIWSFHDEALAARLAPVVPVEVLAQAWRGGPQAELSRLLRGCRIESTSESTAREAGRACALAGTSDVVDAIAVVRALTENALVATSDPDDLKKIADAIGSPLRLYEV